MDETKCPGGLVPMTTSEGVTVDFCPENKGILFEAGEMALYFELSQDFPELARKDAVPTGRVSKCPKHPESRMVEYRFPMLDDLMLDICEDEGCVWFDKGEVPRFEALSARLEAPKSRLFRVFKQLKDSGYRVLGVVGKDEK